MSRKSFTARMDSASGSNTPAFGTFKSEVPSKAAYQIYRIVFRSKILDLSVTSLL